MDTCTEEGAAFNAFVKVVHMIELHPNIRAKHTPLATKNDDFFFVANDLDTEHALKNQIYLFRHKVQLSSNLAKKQFSPFIWKKLCKNWR